MFLTSLHAQVRTCLALSVLSFVTDTGRSLCCVQSLGQAVDILVKKLFSTTGSRKRTKPSPSRTASTIPAVNEEQLNWLMSRGTDMCRSRGGSLSMIMSTASQRPETIVYDRDIHSSAFSTLFSMASAGFPKTARHN
jgi:hypothetical protein